MLTHCGRFIPATTPIFQISKIALVMALLIDNDQDLRCRAHLQKERDVPGCNIYPLITTTQWNDPVGLLYHFLHHVRLPATALVSSTPDHISVPANPLAAWWDENLRVQLGSLLMPCPLIHGRHTSLDVMP
ncbi:hypothetical protein CPB85DRAFT_1549389 [Mucidula mucida]|nr:hypothetical protein CPB85DRAFT_1549389 [Mucidula mucida]